MRVGLIAEKLGMSAKFNEKGERVAVTLLKVDACQILAHKVVDKHGYNAVVLGYKNVLASKVKKPLRQVFAKAKIEPKAKIKEFRVSEDQMLEVGVTLDVSHFKVGQYVDVRGITIGKGFSGSMKRHNFRGLEASHGVSISHRSHGSTGGRQDPGKVFKNKKMAGHMGNVLVAVQNLRIDEIDLENNVLVIRGAIPGKRKSVAYVTDSIKKSLV